MPVSAALPEDPWTGILLRPRETIRTILDVNPEWHALAIVIAFGFMNGMVRLLDFMDRMPNFPAMTAAFGMAAVFGPLGNIMTWYLAGALLRLTGGWLGGQATQREIRTAVAWSQVPGIGALALVCALNLLASAMTPGNLALLAPFAAIALLALLAAIWQMCLFCICLSEAQGFSVWRALGSSLLAGLLILIAVLAVVFLLLVPLMLSGR